jgi:hypothetical protein
MTYYVIASETNQSFEIVKVLPPDEANFLKDYGHRVKATGTRMAEVLHRFAAQKASEWLDPLPLHPKLTRVKIRYPNHEVFRIQSYYRENVGWIGCSKSHPESGKILSWQEQLKIVLMAGASKCRLALSHKKTGSILYAEFEPRQILE